MTPDDHDLEQAWQHHDEELMAQEGLEALKHARALGLPESECMALAHLAGLASDFYKEIRT